MNRRNVIIGAAAAVAATAVPVMAKQPYQPKIGDECEVYLIDYIGVGDNWDQIESDAEYMFEKAGAEKGVVLGKPYGWVKTTRDGFNSATDVVPRPYPAWHCKSRVVAYKEAA